MLLLSFSIINLVFIDSDYVVIEHYQFQFIFVLYRLTYWNSVHSNAPFLHSFSFVSQLKNIANTCYHDTETATNVPAPATSHSFSLMFPYAEENGSLLSENTNSVV
jgi:hypothetical protein